MLIDGNKLAEYLYDFGLGMQVEQTIEIKKLDADFWDAMQDRTDQKNIMLNSEMLKASARKNCEAAFGVKRSDSEIGAYPKEIDMI